MGSLVGEKTVTVTEIFNWAICCLSVYHFYYMEFVQWTLCTEL